MHPHKMMGFEDPGAQKVQVPVRAWNAMKLGLWRSKTALEIIIRAAGEIVARCEHADDCLAKENESVPCSMACRDRQIRASALVVLGAARMFAPVDARQLAREPYHAPSREFFSEVMSELAAAQAELEALREVMRVAGLQVSGPSPNEKPPALPARTPQQLEEKTP